MDQSITFKQDANGFYRFYRDGINLNWPSTFAPYVAPVFPLTLRQLQDNQISTIRMACSQAITSGFTSSALGAAYAYPSSVTDQANMNANVVSSLLPNLPSTWTTEQVCADSNGAWAYRPHTAAQINAITDPSPDNPSSATITAIQSIIW